MVGNRAWSGGRNSRQESALKWRPLKGGISISNQRWGERESERERGRERGSERLWREWRERDKKRGTFTPVWRIRERGRRGGILKGSQGQSAKVKERHRNEGRWTTDRGRRRRSMEGNNVHLWTGWKSSRRRYGHSDRLISTTRPFVFHLRLRQRAVLHGSPFSPLSPPNLIHRFFLDSKPRVTPAKLLTLTRKDGEK